MMMTTGEWCQIHIQNFKQADICHGSDSETSSQIIGVWLYYYNHNHTPVLVTVSVSVSQYSRRSQQCPVFPGDQHVKPLPVIGFMFFSTFSNAKWSTYLQIYVKRMILISDQTVPLLVLLCTLDPQENSVKTCKHTASGHPRARLNMAERVGKLFHEK